MGFLSSAAASRGSFRMKKAATRDTFAVEEAACLSLDESFGQASPTPPEMEHATAEVRHTSSSFTSTSFAWDSNQEKTVVPGIV